MNVYDNIKEAIIQGSYEPGMRLTEESLASEWNISRTPIREALKRLETDGLITPLKRGMIVRTYTNQDIRQIYDLRGLLEGYAASQASLNRTDENLKNLQENLDAYAHSINNHNKKKMSYINDIMEENKFFHDEIFKASKNEHVTFLTSKVVVLPIVFRSFYWYNQTELLQSLEAHKTIYRAIKDQDPERAKTAMLEHIYQGRDCALRNIEKKNSY